SITVQPAPQLTSLVVAPASILFDQPGQTHQLTVTGTYDDGSQEDMTLPGTGTTYETGDPAVAAVTLEGLVSAVGDGQAVITAHNGSFSATCEVTVQTSNLPPDPANVAPPVDLTVATDIAAATEFLYTGDNP